MTSTWRPTDPNPASFADMDWSVDDANELFEISPGTNSLLIVDPSEVKRAETAPMVLTIVCADGTLCCSDLVDDVPPEEEYRYSEEYHKLYYSKIPRDPRMLPPLTRRRLPPIGTRPPVSTTTPKVPPDVPIEGTETEQPSPQYYSPLVKQYIDALRPDWGYSHIKDHVVAFSMDQDGSRLVQRLIERTMSIVPIFEEVYDHFAVLATDTFGNYVLQKLFDVVGRLEKNVGCSDEIRAAHMLERLTACVRGNLLKYSFQMYGCRVMQKALENMRAEDRAEVLMELDGHVTECVFNQNANHVIQKVVEVYPRESQFIVDAFIPSLPALACHAYGCRLLQRIFEVCHEVENINLRPLLQQVLAHIGDFTVHQYGNFVVQHGMINAPEDLRHEFVTHLIPQVYKLSCSKFASNVAEKVVSIANDEERDLFIDHLIMPVSDSLEGNYLVQMMQDTYANYVVQRLLESATPEQRSRMADFIMPYVCDINQSVYGRHLLRKMESMSVLTEEFLRQQGIDVTVPSGGAQRDGAHGGGSGHGSRRGGRGHRFNGGGRGRQRQRPQEVSTSTQQRIPAPPYYASVTQPAPYPMLGYCNSTDSSLAMAQANAHVGNGTAVGSYNFASTLYAAQPPPPPPPPPFAAAHNTTPTQTPLYHPMTTNPFYVPPAHPQHQQPQQPPTYYGGQLFSNGGYSAPVPAPHAGIYDPHVYSGPGSDFLQKTFLAGHMPSNPDMQIIRL